MKTLRIVALVALVALPAAAEKFEKVMLPIAPSTVLCAFHSRYDTRLVVFNEHDRAVSRISSDDTSGGLAAFTGTEISGPIVQTPLGSFLYVPRADSAGLRMALISESMDLTKPEEKFFTELPVVRDGDWRTGRIQIIGVKIEQGFRQTLRIYGYDGHAVGQVAARFYAIGSNRLLKETTYELWPHGPHLNADGLQAGPSFAMECDLSGLGQWEGWGAELVGQHIRIELEPKTPGLKYWAFVSVANNATQHFFTILPR